MVPYGTQFICNLFIVLYLWYPIYCTYIISIYIYFQLSIILHYHFTYCPSQHLSSHPHLISNLPKKDITTPFISPHFTQKRHHIFHLTPLYPKQTSPHLSSHPHLISSPIYPKQTKCAEPKSECTRQYQPVSYI